MPADVVNPDGANATGSAVDATTPSTPSYIDLKEDSLVRLPGNEKPVKYGEWFRDFQGKHTKATQDRSRFEKDLSSREAELKATREEVERYRQALGTPRQEKVDPGAAFQELPYIKGQEAAQLARNFQSELERRDQNQTAILTVVKAMAQKMADQEAALNSVKGRFGQTDFKSKIAKYRADLELPDEAGEYLEELYSAYEGEDLDTEFPNIAKKRFEQLSAMVRQMDKKRFEAARQKPFVAGKGGNASPSKPLDLSRMTSRETADTLWAAMQEEKG